MAKSIVQNIGEMALDFKEEKILILYGPEAPQELKDIAVIHEFEDKTNLTLEAGGTIIIGGQEYQLEGVGSEATKNLKELGHISIYFNKKPEDILPGAVYARPHELPQIRKGSFIEFLPAK